MNNFNLLKWKGPFGGSTSYNGYSIKILKSCLQKYIRRDNFDKAIYAVIELDLFHLLGDNNKGKKFIISNLKNRLICIISEEISISVYWLPQIIKQLLDKYVNTPIPKNRKYLIDIIKYLTSVSKIRLISDLKSVYNIPPYYPKWSLLDHKKLIHNYKNIYKDINESRKNKIKLMCKNYLIYSPKINNILIGIFAGLKYKKDITFKYISDFYRNLDEIKMTKRFKVFGKYKRKKDIILWDILQKYLDTDKNKEIKNKMIIQIKILFEQYYTLTHKEYYIYLYHAYLLVIRRKQINWDLPILNINTTDKEADELYKINLSKYKLKIDNFCKDIHTDVSNSDQIINIKQNKINNKDFIEGDIIYNNSVKKIQQFDGKNWNNINIKLKNLKSTGLIKFCLEGAYITNQNMTFYNDKYREIYNKVKLIQDTKKKVLEIDSNKLININKVSFNNYDYPVKKFTQNEIDIIKELPIGQNRTSSFKKYTHIGKKQIFKGPYKITDKSFNNNLRFTRVLDYIEKKLKLEKKYCAVLNWDYIGIHKNQIYLVAKNIGNYEQIKSNSIKLIKTKIEETYVLDRCSFVNRISELEKKDMSKDMKIAILQHLYIRFILNIGDSGTHNLLERKDNSKQLIAGLDMEEERTSVKSTNNRLNYLFRGRGASKHQIKIYQNYIKYIKLLTDTNNLKQYGINIDLINKRNKQFNKYKLDI